MKKLCILIIVWLSASHTHAALIFVDYDISSPDDLSSLAVGDTVHFDVSLPGLPLATWSDTFIFNMFAESSDLALWSSPFNINVNNDFAPPIVLNATPSRVSMVEVADGTTTTSDFVLDFDVTAVASGVGMFTANGADIFAINSVDTYFTRGDSIEFRIAAVPTPTTLALLGLGLAGLGWSGRKKSA